MSTNNTTTTATEATPAATKPVDPPANPIANGTGQNNEADKNEGTITKSTSTASLPMFVPSSMAATNDEENNLDLDDLFRHCYFGDFAVPAVGEGEANAITAAAISISAPSTTPPPAAAPQTIATSSGPPPPPPPPPVIAPLVPNNTFYSKTNKATTVPVTSSSAVTTAKRKAEEALDQATASSALAAIAKPPAKKPDTGAVAASSKTLTDQQKVERRERNRKHAKRSRLRKKFLLESLQEQINGLQSEIESLKDIIKKECPDKAEKLLQSINGPKANFTPLPMPSGFGPVKALMEPDFRLMSALSGSQQNFAISDPSLPDNPIVYVSQGFLELTGYTLDQVLGRNCRFLQGPGTDQSAVDIIRKGVSQGVDTSVCLLNYKADGTPFWNQFFVAALRDAENNVVNFVGVQCEVSKAVVEKQIAQKEAEAEKAEKES